MALGIGGALALAAARFVRNDRAAATLALVGTWNLIGAAAAALLAIGTGIAALVGLHASPAAHLAVSIHVKWAMLTSMTIVLLAVWRGAGNAHDERPSPLMAGLLLAAAAALATTGYRGDLNVYRYGVGVTVVPAGGPPRTGGGAR